MKRRDQDLCHLGHPGLVVVRSDGEPAIKGLMEKVDGIRHEVTNVRAEREVESVEKKVRVLRLATDQHVGFSLVTHTHTHCALPSLNPDHMIRRRCTLTKLTWNYPNDHDIIPFNTTFDAVNESASTTCTYQIQHTSKLTVNRDGDLVYYCACRC